MARFNLVSMIWFNYIKRAAILTLLQHYNPCNKTVRAAGFNRFCSFLRYLMFKAYNTTLTLVKFHSWPLVSSTITISELPLENCIASP